MHVTDLTMEGFILESSRQLGRRGHLGPDPRPREGFDGPVAAPRLQHGLVFGTWCDTESDERRMKQDKHQCWTRRLLSPLLWACSWEAELTATLHREQ